MDPPEETGARRRNALTIGLVALSLAAITLFDLVIYPGHSVTILYTIPVLIGALRTSPRAVSVVAALSITIDALDALVLHTPLVSWLIRAIVLIVVAGFAVLIAWQRQQLARETCALTVANAQLRNLEQERAAWTSIIAHDLRQPMVIILGYADLLLRQANTHAPVLVPSVEHIRTSAHHLNRMIADLLDVSRITTQRFSVDRKVVNLPQLIHSTAERTAATMPSHPVRVEIVGTIPDLAVDSQRIEQVLDNLLSNAAKYSTPQSEIDLKLERLSDRVQVSVTNQGPGIPPEELPHLFARFYRTQEARAGAVRGLGLGLHISKGIVEAHGGRIWAESVPGQTTRFCFTLPLPGSTADVSAR
jgi:signal transduction histidine kinase